MHLPLFFIMKVDEKDVSSGTVLRNLEEIYSSLEPALPRQRTRNVCESDRKYRGYDDVAITHAITTSYLYMAALPDSHRARDFAPTDSRAKLFRENHVASIPSLRPVFEGGNLDFYLHTRVCEAGRDHHGCRAHLTEVLAQYGPTLGEVAPLGQHIRDSNDVP